MCPQGTHWHRPECAQQCAQTRSDDHHPAPNANQVPNKKRAEISKIPARSVISGSLSKPPPSASRPPHRGLSSIRDTDTYTEALDSDAVKAIPVQTVAFDAKCNQKGALCRRPASRLGHTVWAHSWAHTARFSLGLFRKRKKNEPRRRFFKPSPSSNSLGNRATSHRPRSQVRAHPRSDAEHPVLTNRPRCASSCFVRGNDTALTPRSACARRLSPHEREVIAPLLGATRLPLPPDDPRDDCQPTTGMATTTSSFK